MKTYRVLKDQPIYLKRKAIRLGLALYFLFLLLSIWGFWHGSGHLFTQEYYYPEVVALMPVCFIVFLVLLFKQIQLLGYHEPVIVLNEAGIQFMQKPFGEMGIIAWEDVTGCSDRTAQSYSGRLLFVSVRDTSPYTARIADPAVRSKFIKKCQSRRALLWTEAGHLNCDITELKRTIFQEMRNAQEATDQ